MLPRSKTRTRPYKGLKSASVRAQGPKPSHRSSLAEKPVRAKAGLKRAGFKVKRGLTDTQKADRAFSLMIREAANWRCARCGKDWSENHAGLDCSHYFNVRYYAVRYDPENADALCHLPCHLGEPDGWEFQKQGEYLDLSLIHI